MTGTFLSRGPVTHSPLDFLPRGDMGHRRESRSIEALCTEAMDSGLSDHDILLTRISFQSDISNDTKRSSCWPVLLIMLRKQRFIHRGVRVACCTETLVD